MSATITSLGAYRLERIMRKGQENMQRFAETLTVDPLALQAYIDKIERDCVARAEHLERMAEADMRKAITETGDDFPPPAA